MGSNSHIEPAVLDMIACSRCMTLQTGLLFSSFYNYIPPPKIQRPLFINFLLLLSLSIIYYLFPSRTLLLCFYDIFSWPFSGCFSPLLEWIFLDIGRSAAYLRRASLVIPPSYFIHLWRD